MQQESSRFMGEGMRAALLCAAIVLAVTSGAAGQSSHAKPEPQTRAAATQPAAELPLEQVMTAKSGCFVFMEAINSKGKPDLSAWGLRRVTLVGAQLWPKGEPAEQPDEDSVRRAAWRLNNRGETLVCLDIEHWPLKNVSAEQRTENLSKLAAIADWTHQTAPGLRLGFYAIIPQREYSAVVSGKAARMEVWKQNNEAMAELSRHVDVLFPSLYTFENNPERWQRYAIANLDEARQYGKQVYVFLWPYFHDNGGESKIAGQPLPASFWRLQLETALRHADGVVIWQKSMMPWDEQAEWWRETQSFLREFYGQRPETGEPKR